MTGPLVSVIIPVFNGADSIRDCLRSVTLQTHRDLEIIVISDGSLDETEDIVRKESEADERIALLVQENRGVSSARNRGLDSASGEWVIFVDADDALADPLLVEALVSAGTGADLIGFGARRERIRPDARPRRPRLRSHSSGDTGEIARRARDSTIDAESAAAMVLDESANAIWGKAYRRALIVRHGVRFCEGIRMGEDLLFNLAFFQFAPRMRTLPIDGYLYRMGSSRSATRRYLPNKLLDLMRVNDELRTWARQSGSAELSGAGEFIRAKNVLSCMRDLHHPDCDIPADQRLAAARTLRQEVPTVRTRELRGRHRLLCLAYNSIGARPMFHLAGLADSLR